jgi:hypothetical protein
MSAWRRWAARDSADMTAQRWMRSTSSWGNLQRFLGSRGWSVCTARGHRDALMKA